MKKISAYVFNSVVEAYNSLHPLFSTRYSLNSMTSLNYYLDSEKNIKKFQEDQENSIFNEDQILFIYDWNIDNGNITPKPEERISKTRHDLPDCLKNKDFKVLYAIDTTKFSKENYQDKFSGEEVYFGYNSETYEITDYGNLTDHFPELATAVSLEKNKKIRLRPEIVIGSISATATLTMTLLNKIEKLMKNGTIPQINSIEKLIHHLQDQKTNMLNKKTVGAICSLITLACAGYHFRDSDFIKSVKETVKNLVGAGKGHNP